MLKSLLAFVLCTITAYSLEGRKPTVTIISGFWNVGRGELASGFKRSTDYYLQYFERHLQTQTNMIIFGDQSLRKFVKEKRNHSNTLFILKDLESFYKLWHTQKIIKILERFKTQPVWNDYKQFPQYGLEMYNPVVMSKLFLMNEAMENDIFESDFYAWADAGLLHNFGNQIGNQYVSKKMFETFHNLYQGPWYFHYYEDKNMFRGFGQGELRYLPKKIPSNEMVLANYFGGRIQVVSTLKSVYENFLRITLENYDLGTDQSIFSIMLVRYPLIIPLVNKIEVRDLMYKQKIQSKHYLSIGTHRIFRLKANGTYEFEELAVRKNEKIKFSGAQMTKKSQIAPHSISSSVSRYRIPLLLSQKPISYKIVFLHRLLFIAAIFGLYYSLVRSIYSFKFIRY